MDLKPLRDKLINDGIGVSGKTLFINMLPVNVQSGVLLRNSLNGTAIDYEIETLIKSEFQVIARSTSYQGGEALIEKAIKSLNLKGETIGGYFFHHSRPKTFPVVFPLSEGNLLEFSVYFDVCCYKVA